jgi:hypothetical protein
MPLLRSIFATLLLVSPIFSQQTVFNVPSNEAIDKGSWFAQYQTFSNWLKRYGVSDNLA